MSDVHVVPSGDSWAKGGELVVHGEEGQIRDKSSHGNDPRDIPS